MAFKIVSSLKTSVSGLLQGANLDNVTNLNGALERAARIFLQKAGIPEAIGRQAITLYNGVYDYLAPTSIFGGNLIDIQPQGTNRSLSDVVYKQGIEMFDRNKGFLSNGTAVTFEFINGVAQMRIVSSHTKTKANLDAMNATTGWTASGSASGLTLDQSVFYDNNGSLRFLLTGASTGALTKSISSTDLTAYQGFGVVFLAIRTPSATDLTSIELRIGSSSTNYYSVTATQTFLGAFVANDWTLVAFDLSTATTTGTPVITAINYTQINITHGATLTNFRVGGLFISLPYPSNLIFQSAAIFQASGSAPSQTISSDNDVVNLKDDAYTIYEHECAATIALQSGGGMSGATLGMLNATLNGARARNGTIIQLGLYDLYRAKNPDEALRTTGSYYD